jgi:hypothetical protein
VRESLEGLRKAVEGWRRGWNLGIVPSHWFSFAGGAENPMGGAFELVDGSPEAGEEAVPERVSVEELKPVRGRTVILGRRGQARAGRPRG